MRTLTTALILAVILPATACEESTTRAAGKKLTLTKPADQTIERGATNEISISIDRGGFTGPVNVRFDKLPRGVTVVETKQIAADQSRADYTLHAAPDADLVEDFEASVTVEGPEMMATTQTFLITVEEQ